MEVLSVYALALERDEVARKEIKQVVQRIDKIVRESTSAIHSSFVKVNSIETTANKVSHPPHHITLHHTTSHARMVCS